MSLLHTPARPRPALPPIDLTPTVHTPNIERAAGPAPADELSDDDLESVVGGLARTWTEALRASSRHQA